MARKDPSPKSLDITTGTKQKASPTARPVVIENHTVIANDPMVLSADAGALPTAPVVKRQGKTIAISHDAASGPKDDRVEATREASAIEATDIPKASSGEATGSLSTAADDNSESAALGRSGSSGDAQEASEPSLTVQSEQASNEAVASEPQLKPPFDHGTTNSEKLPLRDSEAEIAASEEKQLEAEAARQVELDRLISAGTYNVPVSLDQRKSRRLMLLSLVGVLLLIGIGGDIMLDSGIVSVTGVPHTHFLSSGAATPSTVVTPMPKAATLNTSGGNRSLVDSKLTAITSGLEIYHVSRGGYPAELSSDYFPDIDPVDLTPPSGITYSYTASPSGCSTEAKNCTSFILTATDTATHAVIATEHSL